MTVLLWVLLSATAPESPDVTREAVCDPVPNPCAYQRCGHIKNCGFDVDCGPCGPSQPPPHSPLRTVGVFGLLALGGLAALVLPRSSVSRRRRLGAAFTIGALGAPLFVGAAVLSVKGHWIDPKAVGGAFTLACAVSAALGARLVLAPRWQGTIAAAVGAVAGAWLVALVYLMLSSAMNGPDELIAAVALWVAGCLGTSAALQVSSRAHARPR